MKASAISDHEGLHVITILSDSNSRTGAFQPNCRVETPAFSHSQLSRGVAVADVDFPCSGNVGVAATKMAPLKPDSVVPAVKQVLTGIDGKIRSLRSLGPRACEVSASLPRGTDVDTVRRILHDEGTKLGADIVVQRGDILRTKKKLAVFDLDSTLITQETIDELAVEAGCAREVSNVTEKAMNGELDFRNALAERVALLRGLSVGKLESVKSRVSFTPGAHRLVKALTATGCETAVISGGFRFLADHVRDELGLTYSFANSLEVSSLGQLTGHTVGDIVDAEFKAATLTRLAEDRGLAREEVLAVGDGSNDLLMLSRAGLGVAFNAKPAVQARVHTKVNQTSLDSILYLLGLSDDNIDDLLNSR